MNKKSSTKKPQNYEGERYHSIEGLSHDMKPHVLTDKTNNPLGLKHELFEDEHKDGGDTGAIDSELGRSARSLADQSNYGV